jgi:hypothetical protein
MFQLSLVAIVLPLALCSSTVGSTGYPAQRGSTRPFSSLGRTPDVAAADPKIALSRDAARAAIEAERSECALFSPRIHIAGQL